MHTDQQRINSIKNKLEQLKMKLLCPYLDILAFPNAKAKEVLVYSKMLLITNTESHK